MREMGWLTVELVEWLFVDKVRVVGESMFWLGVLYRGEFSFGM